MSPLSVASYSLALTLILAAGGLTGCAAVGGGVQAGRPVRNGATAADRPAPSTAEVEAAAAARSPLVGRQAPDFTLPDDQGQPVSLSDFRGKWVVLYFYPQDDTPACTCQATEFTTLLKHFGELDSVVVGVSPDSSEDHQRFREKYDLQLVLLSDEQHQVMEQFGAWRLMGWGDGIAGGVVRTTVLIDPQGRIAHHWPEVVAQGHAQRVHDQLAALQR